MSAATPASAGSGVLRAVVRSGVYFDSVVLMRLQRALAALPEILGAGVVMATPANKEILAESDLVSPEVAAARPDDLLIVVRAASEGAAAEALGEVEGLLRGPRAADEGTYRPRSLRAALGQLPQAQWVMISVPGRHAAALARQALEADRNVFLYSDNVTLEDEVQLKRLARARGRMLMGPDCGTAILSGVGFGFANRVRSGPIGLVGASGTGLQAVASAVDALGGGGVSRAGMSSAGISHALGTGGRDLHAAIGGSTALQAIDLLRRDEGTRVLVVISKPPSPEVASTILAALARCGKPAVVHFLGQARPARRLGEVHFATSLAEAAEIAVALAAAGGEARGGDPAMAAPGAGVLRGLFSGGTLAYEALLGLQTLLGPIESNLHLPGGSPPTRPGGHRLLDLGDDAYTVGRPHPMIDLGALREHLAAAAAEEQVGVVLLDVVLGHGAHADPASELAPALRRARDAAAARGGSLAAVVVLVGTDSDPQDLARQQAELADAGAHVVRSVHEAVDAVARRLAPPAPAIGTPVPLAALGPSIAVINAGLESFHDSLAAQGAAVLQMDWRPPAGGDDRMAAVISRMFAGPGTRSGAS